MSQELERVYTIPLGKVLISQSQHRAVRAINMIKEFAQHHMKVEIIKIDEELAQQIWARGVRSPPRKIKVRMSKTDEGYVLVSPFIDDVETAVTPEKETKKVEDEVEPKQLSSSKDLIERFISTKIKKIDVTKEPLTPKELGRLSLVENEDFVTETLAGIYAKQGKYNKAIKIYQQLILNFPEKSTFFASRIRFLREKMEYDNK